MEASTPIEQAKPGSNMDEFNRLTVFILNDLYDAFPHCSIINAEEYFEDVNEYASSCMDGTMSFLAKEDFITISGPNAEGRLFVGVQLTSKGLCVLNKRLDSLENSPTLIDKFHNAIASGGAISLKEAVKTFISEAIKTQLS